MRVRGQWNRRRDSHEAAIRFGSLLEDLECYLDNSLRRDADGVHFQSAFAGMGRDLV